MLAILSVVPSEKYMYFSVLEILLSFGLSLGNGSCVNYAK